ncbi:phosphodiester glycosidase family protein [Candidatus Falkowbacteria bacterium]|nr:MAG: phosphodiester glycosidase family protein [Candidatus Falkowbacteria bacterium]
MTKTKLRFLLLIIIVFLFWSQTPTTKAASLASQLSGRIVLSVEENGEAWYINPANLRRYFLGRPGDAFAVMRQLGVGITEVDFQKIASSDMPVSGDLELTKRLSGKIILQVEKNGEAWYINPVDLKKYYLGRPDDAFRIMRQLGLGITQQDLALIRRLEPTPSINTYSTYQRRSVNSSLGVFTVDIITIDLSNPRLKIKTLAASDTNCPSNCPAKSLASYYFGVKGFAGINGTYFDTSVSKRNYYFFPIYDSVKKVFINADQLKYPTTGPIMAFDTNNKFYYFKDSREFKSVADFEQNTHSTLQAAFGNKPRLIEQSLNYLIDWEVDEKQRTVKTLRNAIGYANNKLYLVVAHKATVADLGEIMISLGVEYAINLDGGGSSALMYDGEYILGPGRNIPNAIIFSEE